MMDIIILRLGHRLPRDERISTHVALVARAFGADNISYSGEYDSGLISSVEKIVDRWGGSFGIDYVRSPVRFIKEKKEDGFTVVHLTMYGLPLQEEKEEIRKNNKLLLIVGSEQVQGEIYHLADFNISVTNQPHSEVAALAIALDRIMRGCELTRSFDEGFAGEISIEPSRKNKRIRNPI